ncbi:hypothetical protein MTO96_043346 [Rhipicephalus appendiculatus]
MLSRKKIVYLTELHLRAFDIAVTGCKKVASAAHDGVLVQYYEKVGREDGELSYRPSQMMALCLEARSDDTAGLHAFKDLNSTDELAFLFPDRYIDNESYSLLLQPLVVLSGKWLIPLWFRVEMLPSRGIENSRMFLISHEPLVLWYRHLHELETASESRYAEYVELYLTDIYDNGTKLPEDYIRFLRQSSATAQASALVLQAKVFNELGEVITTVGRCDATFHARLTELVKLLLSWNTDDWLWALNAVYGGSSWHEIRESKLFDQLLQCNNVRMPL